MRKATELLHFVFMSPPRTRCALAQYCRERTMGYCARRLAALICNHHPPMHMYYDRAR